MTSPKETDRRQAYGTEVTIEIVVTRIDWKSQRL